MKTEHGVQEVPVDGEKKMQFQQPSVTDCVFIERKNVEQLLPEHLHIKEEPEMLSEGQEENQLCVKQETNSAACSVKCEYEEETPQASQLYWRQPTEMNIKEEPEMFSEGQEEKQLCVKQETNSAACSVKCEDEEEKPQASQLHWRQPTEMNIKEEPSTCTLDESMKIQSVGINNKRPEAARKPDPCSLVLQGPRPDGMKTDLFLAEYSRKDDEDCWQKPLSESKTEEESESDSNMKKVQVKMTPERVGGKKTSLGAASKLRIHTGETPFKCDVCGKCFASKANLRKHMIIHTGERPFACDVCSKCFNVKPTLKKHMRVHTGEKPFTCNVCSKCFNCKTILKKHMRIHTGEKPFKCDVCSKCFTRKVGLQGHMMIHTGEKPHECDVCSKRFIHKSQIQQHMKIHTGEKPFTCNVCSKCFNCKANFKKHMAIHTGEKPFKCDVCSQCFHRKANLKRHMELHTGEKPFKCDVCSQCFNCTTKLKQHMKIHTGEKPFTCDGCGKCFIQNQDIKSHVIIDTGEQPFKCDVCRKRTTLKVNLKGPICIYIYKPVLSDPENSRNLENK